MSVGVEPAGARQAPQARRPARIVLQPGFRATTSIAGRAGSPRPSDAAVVGLGAVTNIAAATQIYLRYDGGVGGGTDNHALNVGLA